MANSIDPNLKKSKEYLDKCIQERRILIDTCSLLKYPAIDLFWEHVNPLIEKYNAVIAVPIACVRELQKHEKNDNDKDLQKRAKNSLDKLAHLQKSKKIDLYGEANDDFADPIFNSVCVRFKHKYKLMVITQDSNLSDDILGCNNLKSQYGYDIYVAKIDENGYLKRHYSKTNFA